MGTRRSTRSLLDQPPSMALGDKMQRLAAIAPRRLRAIEVLVDEALAQTWPDYVESLLTDSSRRTKTNL